MKNMKPDAHKRQYSLKYLLFSAILLLWAVYRNSTAQQTFPIPSLLTDNVTFWIKIYTETGLNEGLFHDRDYPVIVYEKISFESAGSVHQGKMIEHTRQRIRGLLKRILLIPPDSLSEKELYYRSLYIKSGSIEALQGVDERIRFQRWQSMKRWDTTLNGLE